MHTSFVILHYLAEDTTCECIDSLLSLHCADDISIVVVDNCSPDGSGKRLQNKYATHNRIHFVMLESNEGFARGNNEGYRYAVDCFNPDFIVVMNNDVMIDDSDFIKKIESAYTSKPFAVLGPDIITADGQHQNPLRTRPLTLREVHSLLRKMRIKLAFFPLFYVAGLCASASRACSQALNPAEACVLHGACYIFSRDFIKARPNAFNPGTFLYCEEDILAVECRNSGLAVRYSPSLAVKHLEDKSTSEAHKSEYRRARQKYVNLVRSLKVLVETSGERIL